MLPYTPAQPDPATDHRLIKVLTADIPTPHSLLRQGLVRYFTRGTENYHTLRSLVGPGKVASTNPPPAPLCDPPRDSCRLSLRAIDYFVTCIAPRKAIRLSNGQDLYESYKQQLLRYSKLYFDPFARRERTELTDPKTPHERLTTTIGQMQFVRWMIDHGILSLVGEHLDDIKRELFVKSTGRKRPYSERST